MKIPASRLRTCHGDLLIDGSQGEGGGQIVRTACALSALTGIPVRIKNIRAGRKTPGLRAQHCTALKGLARMSGARTTRLKVGVKEITFTPGESLGDRELDLDTGTAGSVSLVLQGLQVAALGASDTVHLILRGGTDVPGAPSCDYVKNVKLRVLRGMGYEMDLRILKRGYYPKGGGIIDVRIQPPGGSLLPALEIPFHTEIMSSHGVSHASSEVSQNHMAEKQGRAATKILTDYLHVPAKVKVEYGQTQSPGSGVVVWAVTKESVFGASALNLSQSGSESPAEEATEKLLRTYHTRAAVDSWLGDQILPYMALGNGPSIISVPRFTRHMKTNMWVIQSFLKVRFFCEKEEERILVHCHPE